MSADPYDLYASGVPQSLSSFVRDEVRPLLVQQQQTAQDALERWLEEYAKQVRRLCDWEAARDNLLHQSQPLPADPEHRPDQPGEDWTWAEQLMDPVSGELRNVACWMPPELNARSRPPLDSPLPPPSNRDPSLDECWAALLAVHDETRDTRECLGPTDCRPFDVLRTRVAGLSEEHLDGIRRMLCRVTAGRAQTGAVDAASANPLRSNETDQREEESSADPAPPAAGAKQGEGGSSDPPADPYADLRRFARSKLKGQERAVIEALCDAGGELLIVNLALKDGISWNDPFQGFKDAQRRLNRKLKAKGLKLKREDNAVCLRKLVGAKEGAKSAHSAPD